MAFGKGEGNPKSQNPKSQKNLKSQNPKIPNGRLSACGLETKGRDFGLLGVICDLSLQRGVRGGGGNGGGGNGGGVFQNRFVQEWQ